MNYLNLEENDLVKRGAIDTAREISGQPMVWKSTYEKLLLEQETLQGFLQKVKKESVKIILTGAGTSAFVGYSLEGAFQRHTGITTVSVATTHLVTHPEDYMQKDMITLIVSFARSGNSPESVAVMKLADSHFDKCFHLVITCDENGELAKYKSKHEKLNFVLPKESNDKSLAMTGSYTGMLLSGLLISQIEKAQELSGQVDRVIAYANNIINNYSDKIAEIAKSDFERVVFLGSGPLYGTATESQLKLQELTDGQIVCKNDTFLGFRHGPKAVVNERSLVVFIFSNEESVLRYERDLVKAMANGKKPMMLIGVSESAVSGISLDQEIIMSEGNDSVSEEFLPVCSVLPGQMLGFFKSLDGGLKPDSPSVSGAISRVVQGVVIYE